MTDADAGGPTVTAVLGAAKKGPVTSVNTATTTRWRRSRHSTGQGGDCVEVARLPGLIAVRDSKHPNGPLLTFGPDAFVAFAQKIRAGRHDL